ncbi:glycosyltransferase family 2 protein [Pseudoflavonifractor phocaeensis]|uniref:glycosyltransferase family 2 protein n=1 Tax=Pseudoflavonifractor phocaeensis TaxID=1870988 RepID=UPI001958F130|nr:glycosyltransferase family 2 protein [Pseudoflavonifractor phocaeensis]MBM6885153.1 glycosyltransferase family 2 protein [Pseudoflavonifractor phocaeensis]
MKTISVTIPCWSEEKSVRQMYDRLMKVFQEKLPQYDYEIIYVDDCSPDNTRAEIRKLCQEDKKVKAVFNARNFGFNRNVFATMQYGCGDATFLIFGDLQDPPEELPAFVKEWEAGHMVVVGQKVKSRESKIMYSLRTLYYHLIGKLSDSGQIQHFNGFGLYDRAFIDVMRQIEDPNPYLKGLVSEFGMGTKILQYEQAESNRGKSGFNFMKYYDVAMLGITSYTKILMRVATFLGALLGIVSICLAIFVLISKLLNWGAYPYGTAATLVGVFFIGAVQLFFMGILGEYVLSINTRSMKRPLVVVGEKINFESTEVRKGEGAI